MAREIKRAGLEVKFTSDGSASSVGEFEGYGACFGNVDSYGDVIEKGAFSKTLKEWKKRGKYPPMLLQHGGMFGPVDDGIPIGCYDDMYEDSKGLVCKGTLFCLDTDKGKYIHAGLKSGALDGLSIGYVPIGVSYGTKPEEPRRKLTEVELWEVSIVTYPANDTARVSSAKAIQQMSGPELERFLKQMTGFTDEHVEKFMKKIAEVKVPTGWPLRSVK